MPNTTPLTDLPASLQQQLAPVLDELETQLDELRLVYLFGSRASGQAGESSDWDLAILNAKRLDPLLRWDIQQQLAQHLNADVDLVDLLDASTVLQMQVVTKGKRLYGTQHEDDLFAMQVYSMYGNLQDSRKAIIDDFIATNQAKSSD